MKRPHLIHFIAIQTKNSLRIKTSLALTESTQNHTPSIFSIDFVKGAGAHHEKRASFPIQAYRMLTGQRFTIKVRAIDDHGVTLFSKVFESDRVGSFNFKIPFSDPEQKLKALQIYEIGYHPGLELNLGSFIPLIIKENKNIVICDFDKTLVDTKYSTTKELYTSLTQPIDYFPTVTNSVALLKNYIDKGFHPFILSASPHFYENAMRDWLYQNQIYTAGIFLKDYRHIFNLLELDLTPKDLKVQGMYKLNHLLDIILMVGLPEELILMGDNFESDPIIYLALSSLLKDEMDPWKFIQFLDRQDSFQMNKKQKAHLLSKSYQIGSLVDKRQKSTHPLPLIKIHIRKKVSEDSIDVPKMLRNNLDKVELYEGLPEPVKSKAVEQKV